jgi:mersacidin/lichenicidin family type 2 lantibiotic
MKIDIVRAWKDSEYRNSLTAEEQASLPPNPAEVSDTQLDQVSGGMRAGAARKLGMDVTLGGPTRCGTEYPECCYNSTIGPLLAR